MKERRMSRVYIRREIEAPIEEANDAVVEAGDKFAPTTRAALDLPLRRDDAVVFVVLGNRALRAVLLLEELELPPLIHLESEILVFSDSAPN